MSVTPHPALLPLDAVDTHCHFDLIWRQDEAAERADAANVLTVAVSSRPTQYRSLKKRFSGDRRFRIGLGFHPELAGSYDEPHELKILREHHAAVQWIAEIGLDRTFVGVPTLEKQVRVFREILALGTRGKIYSVHSQKTEELVLDELAAAGAGHVVMHGFSGDQASARRALDAGYYISFNPWTIVTDEGHELARFVPVDRLLLETDGPFSTWDGAPGEPAHIPAMASLLAQILATPRQSVRDQLVGNFLDLEKQASSDPAS